MIIAVYIFQCNGFDFYDKTSDEIVFHFISKINSLPAAFVKQEKILVWMIYDKCY